MEGLLDWLGRVAPSDPSNARWRVPRQWRRNPGSARASASSVRAEAIEGSRGGGIKVDGETKRGWRRTCSGVERICM